jgi:hypothetical protein
VWIDFKNLFNRLRDDKSRMQSPFDSKDDSLCAFDANSWWSELNWKSFTLMASMAYSTWKIRPSGEKVLMPRS